MSLKENSIVWPQLTTYTSYTPNHTKLNNWLINFSCRDFADAEISWLKLQYYNWGNQFEGTVLKLYSVPVDITLSSGLIYSQHIYVHFLMLYVATPSAPLTPPTYVYFSHPLTCTMLRQLSRKLVLK